MPDQLLSIQDSTMLAIKNAIHSKNGQSGNMTPAQMASAIEALDTYPAATKLTPTSKVLTQNDTSYPVPVGVHDGTETVSIQLDSLVTVTPSNVQQEIVPSDSNHFLGDVKVNGVSSSGYKFVTGTKSASATSFTVTSADTSDFNFTAAGMIVVASSTVSGSRPVASAQAYGDRVYAYFSLGRSTPFTGGSQSLSRGTATINTNNSSYTFSGTYRYLIWGN